MKKRNVAALTILGTILLGFGFLATPLMRHVRAQAWDAWVYANAKVFRIDNISVSDSDLTAITKLTNDTLRLNAELREYRRLKDQLGMPAFDDRKKIPVAIISRPSDATSSRYVINKGVADGIVQGAPVVIQGSVLIGFTKELSQHASVVETLFSPNTSVTVETIAPDDSTPSARGLLESKFQTSLYMHTVPRDVPLSEGQQVITSNKDAAIPFGMIIGNIATIHNSENEAYQSAVIDVPYDLNSLDAAVVLVQP